jgi:hypothetical protein
LARQICPLQEPVQQTWPADCVFSQASELQSPSMAQDCPAGLRHWPRTNVSLGSGQTHDPSTPQARPDAAQLAVQQRIVPATSAAHRVEPHWPLLPQACPLPRRPVHKPVAGEQPFPHVVCSRSPFSHRWDRLPAHAVPVPSHSTHADPSAPQKAPGQFDAQQMLGPATVATQAPEAQSVAVAQASPSFN